MKRVGNILKTRREEKGYTIQDVNKFVKIHPKYILALESGDYSLFSDIVHAKGFLKNYAQVLDLNVDEVLAFWRREYEAEFEKKQQVSEKKRFVLSDVNTKEFIISPKLIFSTFIFLLVTAFFGYIYYQYSTYSGAPRLDIFSPQDNLVVSSSTLDIIGRTERDAALLINNQLIVLNPDGSFTTTLSLNPGINSLTFSVTSSIGKKTEIVKTVIYRPVEVGPVEAN
ncbi:helix-turn-helix domain-containing protein [candidate division WWE3 bacterium]|uniref:Helix-turn-helix domain-containing protein n=1 Tax=candidate division WWE3 bacterium TaxID=2053526 RepID=A0A955EBK8_UNCKA|nr:helix-turn-helix domain-containing protein [candidate division WWE3 bacterium]